MKIDVHENFDKAFRKRVNHNRKLVLQVHQRIALFQNNPNDPQLKNHRLTGSKKGQSAFSVTGDIRVIYRFLSDNHILLLDIGTHNQVY